MVNFFQDSTPTLLGSPFAVLFRGVPGALSY
jgi:hypothetical protein